MKDPLSSLSTAHDGSLTIKVKVSVTYTSRPPDTYSSTTIIDHDQGIVHQITGDNASIQETKIDEVVEIAWQQVKGLLKSKLSEFPLDKSFVKRLADINAGAYVGEVDG